MNYTKKYSCLPDEIVTRLSDGASVLFSEEWFNYNTARGEELCYIWDNRGCLVIRIKTVMILKAGILDCENYMFKDVSEEKQQKFLDDCCETIRKNKIVDWIQTEISANFTAHPTNSVVFGSGNYVLTIDDCTDDELFMKMHSKNRNMIRRGEREGITIARGRNELVDDYKSLEDQVWGRQGRAKRSVDHYTEILDNMPTASALAVAYNPAGEPEAGTLFLYNKTMAYYHHGASRTNHTIGAHNYLLYQQILYMKHLGVKKINFVGYRRKAEQGLNAKADSIQAFKSKFGGEAVETYGFKVEFSRLKYKLYRIANKYINHDQLMDIYDSRSRNYPEYNK